ncbi:unnamed protein product [Eruca vesicaria subsp. sativa]|uniref:Small ribosomal subunit protein mS38 n=1 Tax=Eruca vesicaria subsp. sativa TaxID=29727 RepID=A0ABC8LTF7_ERUVS|nr:unnamed protein product [Eruca vesicaria subsp. sativa]
MANLMQRFIRNQSCLRALPRLTPNLTSHQKPCIVESVSDPVPLTNPVITISGSWIKPDEALRFYPSFPIGYGLNPSVVHASGLMDTVVEGTEKEVVIHADSVKKKRKKKMNKHKYRKLRKKQGRKS